jgi:mannose-6-phosphate isomerase-like protein (cupin superfamily)
MDRRDVLGTFLTMMAAARAAEGAPAASSAPWPEAVFTLREANTVKETFGETTVYFDGATDQLKQMTAGSVLLGPGQEPHPPHQHPEEEFMLIGEGSGEILVHGKKTEVGPGALMYSAGNHLHGIKNTGSSPLRFYFFKWLAKA